MVWHGWIGSQMVGLAFQMVESAFDMVGLAFDWNGGILPALVSFSHRSSTPSNTIIMVRIITCRLSRIVIARRKKCHNWSRTRKGKIQVVVQKYLGIAAGRGK